MRELETRDLTRQRAGIHRLRCAAERLTPSRQIDALAGHDELFAVRQRDDADVEALCGEMRLPLVQLAEERAADVADADNRERERSARLETPAMDDVHRARELRRVHDERQAAIDRSVRDRADGDVVAAERAEDLSGDVRSSLHAVADDGDDGLIRFLRQRRGARVELEAEFTRDRVARSSRLARPHRQRDRAFRRRLAEQHDADALRVQRATQPLRRAEDADRTRPLQCQQRHIVDRADACRGPAAGNRDLRDARTGRRRIEAVLDDDRDRLRDGRTNGGGVQHLRAEVRHLHRFFVRHLRQDECRADTLRIGAQHAVDVGPDLDDRRVERAADNGRRVVGSVSANGRRAAVFGPADEAGDDRNRASALSPER